MEIVHGKDLLVFAHAPDGGMRAVAVSTACVLEVEQEAREVSWPGSGRWRCYRAGWLGWRVTVEGLVGVEAADPLEWLDGSLVRLRFATVAPHPGGEPVGGFAADGRVLRSGEALVTSVSEAGEDGSAATRSVSFQGTGPLSWGGVIRGDYSGDFNADYNIFTVED